MRKIKFRAWNKLKKKMIIESVECNIGIILENKNDFELMQFTGLYDDTKWEDLPQFEQQLFRISLGTEFGNIAKKEWKGKEIFEGDILKIKPNPEDTEIIDVIFYKGCFCYKTKDGGIFAFYSEISWAGITTFREVIGNIYENSELLEVEK